LGWKGGRVAKMLLKGGEREVVGMREDAKWWERGKGAGARGVGKAGSGKKLRRARFGGSGGGGR